VTHVVEFADALGVQARYAVKKLEQNLSNGENRG
jgi:hypothetical protein